MKTLKDFKVHPVAAMFPLLDESSEEMKMLRGGVSDDGLIEPIVLDGEVLLDGRNRLRACELEKVEPRFTQFVEIGVNLSPAEWVYQKNASRRNLDKDQLVAIYTQYNKWSMKNRAEEAKAKGQFKSGNLGGPGRGKTADTKSYLPLTGAKQKNARSTIGQIAQATGASYHKARQAVAVLRAEASGEVPEGTMSNVASGKEKLSDAAKKVKPKSRKPKKVKPLRDRYEAAWKKFCAGFKDDKDLQQVITWLKESLL